MGHRRRLFLLQENCLRLMGHSMDSESNGSALTLALKYFGTLLFVGAADIVMMAYVYNNRHDVELMTASLSVLFTNLLTVVKILTFLVHKRNFWQLIRSFRRIYPQPQQHADGDGDGEFVGYAYLAEDNKLATMLSRGYCISCGCTGLYFMVDPIFKIIVSNWRGEDYVREMPMPLKFPYDDVNSPGYEISYMYTLFVTIAVVLYASAVDGLFISFAIHLRAHFLALQQRIRQLKLGLADEAAVQQQLVHVVQYHVRLLDLANQLRATYMPIVFGQFLITSIQLGVIIYQILTHTDESMALLRFFSFLGSIMVQLFLYCYGGELVKNEARFELEMQLVARSTLTLCLQSMQVSIAVQLADWHLATPKQRRSLAFIMQRSQQALLIRAGFYEASLENFVAVGYRCA
ncbi:hypothetical protein KR093_006978 [Drosophila rubida]|uniref:Odorant receptor n=1 Tax=Drosophila rubida TaxID=30044 RepID=A0AAD4PI76_9MUSC|nr:hypothetical protein KR093_006978 [Drosophila rubida]